MNYYLYQNKEKTGPYSFGQLKEMESAGTLSKEDQVYSEAKARWQAAGEMHGLFGNPFPKWSTNQKVLAGFGIGCGSIVIFFVLLLVGIERWASSSHKENLPQLSESQSMEDYYLQNAQQYMELRKQIIFDHLHPIGTVKRLKLHEAFIDSWKGNKPSRNPDDVTQFTLVYTLYWEGPLTKDGFTKIAETFDTQSERPISGKIIATNGTTNSEVNENMAYLGGFIGGAILRQALTPSQQQ